MRSAEAILIGHVVYVIPLIGISNEEVKIYAGSLQPRLFYVIYLLTSILDVVKLEKQ